MTQHVYRYLFGPVPSRRLGHSLGIDLTPPKTCSLNCIYCECGATTKRTTKRTELVPTSEVITEIDDFLKHYTGTIDYLTFSGHGEPTLHNGIGRIITHIHTTTPYKTAVITNSTLFHLRSVRDDIKNADIVMPTLSTLNESDFKKIHNPAHGITAQSVYNGLLRFSEEYTGTLWLEVFFIKGINDTDENLSQLRSAVAAINPTAVQLNTIDRPAWAPHARPVDTAFIEHAQLIIGAKAQGIPHFQKNAIDKKRSTDHARTEIIALIARRPETIENISAALELSINDTKHTIKMLLLDQKITEEIRDAKIYYKVIE